MSATPPHLRLICPGGPPAQPPLSQAAALAVDSAELFAYSLDAENLTDDPGRAARLLGLAEAHLISLIAILRAVTA